MTKPPDRLRKNVSFVILVTFLLETTVVAEVRMLQSVLHASAAPRTPSRALVFFPETPVPPSSPEVSTPLAGSSGAGGSSPSPVRPISTPASASSVRVGEIIRLSLSSAEDQGNRDSQDASSSADGRWVAFSSRAKNLVPGDTNYVQDVFVRDRESGETFRVSVSTNDGTEANAESGKPSISTDGRFVAFESKATNLVDGDTNGKQDVFVHGRDTGETVRVSVASDGGQADEGSGFPAISADGRFVAFQSTASNLLPGGTNGKKQIFVHDRDTGEVVLVSVSGDGSLGNNDSSHAAISADGRFVAFQSKATNLVPSDTNKKQDIFTSGKRVKPHE